MEKYYSIKTNFTTLITSNYEEAKAFSTKHCAPIQNHFPQLFNDKGTTPMKTKINEEYGEVTPETIHKYIISHPEEAGKLFTREAYNKHILEA